MLVIIDHSPVNQPDGLQTFGPADIGDAVTKVKFRVARCTLAAPTIWPLETTQLAVQLYVSLDGGVTWLENVGLGNIKWDESSVVYGAKGARYVDWRGVETTEHVGIGTIQPGTGRKAAAKVAVQGGPLVSLFTLETV